MGFLVMEVASLAGDVLMRLGQEYQRFGASVAAFRAARVAKDSNPRSIPVSWPVAGSG